MSASLEGTITRLLRAASDGDKVAQEELWKLVADELRKIARQHLGDEKPGHLLQTTALLNEAYDKLRRGEFKNRRHFFGAAANAMRQILVDYARKSRAAKRGGDRQRVELFDGLVAFERDLDEVLAVNDALGQLRDEDPAAEEVVLLLYYTGMTRRECAEILEIDVEEVDRRWALARAYLGRILASSVQRADENP
ncbi:MAG: ECF-type sigma factor [Phycisphaerales bacterium]|nr:ECF-type sigma factor [Phycisphaerales bacterium]